MQIYEKISKSGSRLRQKGIFSAEERTYDTLYPYIIMTSSRIPIILIRMPHSHKWNPPQPTAGRRKTSQIFSYGNLLHWKFIFTFVTTLPGNGICRTTHTRQQSHRGSRLRRPKCRECGNERGQRGQEEKVEREEEKGEIIKERNKKMQTEG